MFEVSWSGKGRRPNMAQLLGEYFSRYSNRNKKGKPTHRRLDRVDTDFILHSGVHNRYFYGSAYVPKLLPITLSGPIKVSVGGKHE